MTRFTLAVTTTLRRDVSLLLPEMRRQAPLACLLLIVSGRSQSGVDGETWASVAACGARVVYAPRGYASARNRALEAAVGSDVLVFFDDDQMPCPEWFDAVERVMADPAVDVAFGPVRTAPTHTRWVRAEDIRVVQSASTGVFKGDVYSGNTALRLSVVGDVRFDEAFNVGGGEDTLFFRQLRAGALAVHFIQSMQAIEYTDPSRLSIHGRYRSGVEKSVRMNALNGRGWRTLFRRLLRFGRALVTGPLCVIPNRAHYAGRAAFDVGIAIGFFYRAQQRES